MEKKKSKEVELQKLIKKRIRVKVRGNSLLMNNMGEKHVHSEEEELESKIHRTPDGQVGFPAYGFMKGMIKVASHVGLHEKDVRVFVRVLGNVIPITFKERKTNVVWGRAITTTKSPPTKIVFPEFRDWSCELDILCNAADISDEQVVNLVRYAGLLQGVGIWRPGEGGAYGWYDVAEDDGANIFQTSKKKKEMRISS